MGTKRTNKNTIIKHTEGPKRQIGLKEGRRWKPETIWDWEHVFWRKEAKN